MEGKYKLFCGHLGQKAPQERLRLPGTQALGSVLFLGLSIWAQTCGLQDALAWSIACLTEPFRLPYVYGFDTMR